MNINYYPDTPIPPHRANISGLLPTRLASLLAKKKNAQIVACSQHTAGSTANERRRIWGGGKTVVEKVGGEIKGKEVEIWPG
ncbi:uncharacterized protein YALI1_F05900g [Yarrowia lipolytica]|uniref:Uncharacterized protein n=1 Tax=Yarrowia lipolytica TaxID=4952 RepID=A0A1D8NLV6_YARLL|nr:hypothetical protein YALI1_F05900g [Yarrowia lipolytica]